MYEQEYNLAILSVGLKEIEIRKAVTHSFYNYQYLKKREKLLINADTLFAKFYAKASLRLQKGESNILEKVTAETQKANIEIDLKQLRQQITVTLLQFQLLLNTNEPFEPVQDEVYSTAKILTDSLSLANNPLLAFLQKQKEIAAAQTNLQKARLSPDFTLGYFNNSFRGTGADNKVYGAGRRFHSAQVSVAIPIFSRSQKERIKAFKVAEDIAQNEYEARQIALQTQYNIIIANYNNIKETVAYYETKGLANAQLITETANTQFINGDINYLDYVVIVNQAISINNNYVEARRTLNESIIEINFLQIK